VDNRVAFDYTRLTQFVSWSGWIEIDGQRIDVSKGFRGCRDRSWGVRPVGARIQRPPTAPQFFWIWCPVLFDNRCTHVAINHDGEGKPWHQSGAVVPQLDTDNQNLVLDPTLVQRASSAKVDLTWQPGTRWAEKIATELQFWNGDPVTVDYQPLLRFHMSGLGYTHPAWGHGQYLGDDWSHRDEIEMDRVDPADPSMIHIQALAQATMETPTGTQTGVGVVEQLAIGPHPPTGLTGMFDGSGPKD